MFFLSLLLFGQRVFLLLIGASDGNSPDAKGLRRPVFAAVCQNFFGARSDRFATFANTFDALLTIGMGDFAPLEEMKDADMCRKTIIEAPCAVSIFWLYVLTVTLFLMTAAYVMAMDLKKDSVIVKEQQFLMTVVFVMAVTLI